MDLFVDPVAGSDGNPGTRREAAFATVARALAAAEGARATIRLRGGVHALAAPLRVGAAHSGLTVAAEDGERPVLSGGRRVGPWRRAEVAGLPAWAAPAGGRRFRQLWVDGERRPRPRLPKAGRGFLRIAGVPDATPETPWNVGQARFAFAPGDVRASWRNLADVEAVVLHFWVDSHLPLRAVDEAAAVASTARTGIFRLRDDDRATGARYYLDNVAEALTEPGEWYLDRAADTVLYLPRPGEDPEAVAAVAPALAELLVVDGAEGVTLRGLTLAHAEWEPPAEGPGGAPQAAVDVPGAVRLRDARGCVFEDCAVLQCGTYGVEVGPGCAGVSLRRCRLADLGAGGVRVEAGSSGTEVTACEIAHLGRIFHAGVGVLIRDSAGNRVADCHIHDLYYTAVSVGWVWGYGPAHGGDNHVLRNHIHDVGHGLLNDMGGIYTLGAQPGTVLRGNRIHDVRSHGYGGWGIYTDEGSAGIVIEDNLVYRTKTGGFHQHYGRDNVVRNNVFVDAAEGQIQRSRIEAHRSFTFERNIVAFTAGPVLHGDWREPAAFFDHNLYWDATGRPLDFGRGRSFAEWQGLGMDLHSAVGDPRFVDWAGGDFRLRPDSPAPALGFRPFEAGPADG